MVDIYTSNGCTGCKAIKEELNNRNIKYNELNISDAKNKIKLLQAGFMKVPIIFSDGVYYETLKGFLDSKNL